MLKTDSRKHSRIRSSHSESGDRGGTIQNVRTSLQFACPECIIRESIVCDDNPIHSLGPDHVILTDPKQNALYVIQHQRKAKDRIPASIPEFPLPIQDWGEGEARQNGRISLQFARPECIIRESIVCDDNHAPFSGPGQPHSGSVAGIPILRENTSLGFQMSVLHLPH
ncbi:hypothetical protein CEXT_580791 [Caerostris extrusa]|uniref:Uncharacterized protein n=1 Tax=Caerostris extrusa TaxID=172846 RepID=A0AAV4V1U5_CAEEX|nr:hypothetical protein CEXT_580791 [Caerostris extrusa]